MTRRTTVAIALLGALPLALGGAAAAYGSYYQDRALPGSSVADLDVAGMTRADLVRILREKTQDLDVAITSPAGTHRATLADLGVGVDVEATADRVLADRDWRAYATAPFEARTVEPVVTRDTGTLKQFLADLGRTHNRKATNAAVLMKADKKAFTITKATPGRALDASPLADAATKAARALTSGAATVTVTDVEAEVTTAEAKAVADKANALVRSPVRITDGAQTFVASGAEKASWVTLPAAIPGEVTVDQAKVAAWVDQATGTLNRTPANGVRYVNAQGKVLRVLATALDGQKVTNAKSVSAAVAKDLLAGTRRTVRVKTTTIPATWEERKIADGAQNLAYAAAPGEKWVDVNLSRHTMTPYVGGSPAAGTVSMVHGAPDTPSDVGTFRIYMKNPMMTMRGQNADGSDYETPDVPWSSFYNGGEALHGAYWRETWGYAASHGCINLPIPTAKWIYDWAPIGTPVVVHY